MSVGAARLAGLALSTIALLPVSIAFADQAAIAASDSSAQSDQLETVTVTAQRRSENVEKVPIAVSAVSGATLTEDNITNLDQLSHAVPGLNLEYNVGNALLFIRGVGTTALAVENDVGLYVDGVYITSQAGSLLNLTNVDHVEVLKGPQGTLFGRNAIGGAVSVVTKDPSSTPSADFSVGYANYNTVSTNFYGTTGVAANLATDLAFYYRDQATGWGNDLTTNTPTYRSREIEVRNKWVYTPGDDTKITLSVDYAQLHNGTGIVWSFLPGAVGADGRSSNAGFYNALGNINSQTEGQQYGSMIRVDQNLGWARGVSITSIRASTNHNYLDQDGTPLQIVEGGPTPQNDRSYSEELQLLSPDSSNIKWIVGAYALYDKYYTPGFTITVGPPPLTTEVIQATEPTKSYAGFAQATMEVLPDTHLTAGVRYTNDHKSVSGQIVVNGTVLPPVIPGMTSPANQSTIFDKTTYRVVLDHQLTPNMFTYVSYDTGFKSGQYNLISYADPPVRPETLDAWQAGIKSEFMDHKLRLNLAGFHYDYSNIQITQVVTGGTELLNAAAAELYGADVDFDLIVTPEFKVQGAAEWLHGRYTNFTNAPSYVPNINPGTGAPAGANQLVTIDATGNHSVHSPDATAYLAGDYTIPFAAGRLEFNMNVSYNSGFYWDPDNRLRQPSYALLGAFAKWIPSEQHWDLQLWGNNITDRKYYSYESAFSLGDVYSAAAPATYGVTATFHF